jgi:hypothetical protein
MVLTTFSDVLHSTHSEDSPRWRRATTQIVSWNRWLRNSTKSIQMLIRMPIGTHTNKSRNVFDHDPITIPLLPTTTITTNAITTPTTSIKSRQLHSVLRLLLLVLAAAGFQRRTRRRRGTGRGRRRRGGLTVDVLDVMTREFSP